MRGRTKLISVVTMLAILLSVSLVFASGILDVSKVSLLGAPGMMEPDSPGPTTVALNPIKTVKDWLKFPAYRTGNTFTVVVNTTDVADLYTWQINITWSNKTVLNVNRIILGEFLATSPNSVSSEVLGFVINSTSNANGYSASSETLLSDPAGITGSGNLTKIQFSIINYGWTLLNISITGTLPTILLDSTGATIAFSTVHANIYVTSAAGYFSNRLLGDCDSNRKVVYADFSILAGSYGSHMGQVTYKVQADFDYSGDVVYADFSALAGNYGKSV